MTASDPRSASSPSGARDGVRFDRAGASVVITLDRPAKLNAINSGIKTAISKQIPIIARDPQVYAVLYRAAPSRMFSAGGDIREIHDLARTAPSAALAECAREYGLMWLLECFSKPTVALIDGAVLGTGAGLVLTATHRVAGAGYRFQMPETAIGYFPDNGVAWHLARMPYSIGVWLGLTGTMIDRPDAFWLGLATHCVDAGEFDAVAALIADAEPIDQVLDARHVYPGPPPLERLAPVIARCFQGETVEEIMSNLTTETKERAWCEAQLELLKSRSPLALAVTLELIRRARHLDLRQILTLEFRLARKLCANNDFFEGVRTVIIEKSGTPAWRPARLADLDRKAIDRLFEPRSEGEMILPVRAEMQAARV